MTGVAALYIDDRGPYPKLLGADACWGIERDARLYEGPWPVVAHPPCAPWTSLRTLCNRDDEKAIGLRAVEQVQRWGGVLEQPAGSLLWDACGLPKPSAQTIRAIEVEQVDWGHVARKRTWLYFVGVNPFTCPGWPKTRGTPTHWCSGSHKPGDRGETPPGIKVCSAQQRRRTPVAFAEWLILIARRAQMVVTWGGRKMKVGECPQGDTCLACDRLGKHLEPVDAREEMNHGDVRSSAHEQSRAVPKR